MSTTTTLGFPLGDWLRRLREEAGITSTHQLAKLPGTPSQSYIWKVESGEHRVVKWAKLRGWVTALDGDMDEARELWMAAEEERALAATLPPDVSSIDSPGWMCLPPLTAISDAVHRTLVPLFARPLAHPA